MSSWKPPLRANLMIGAITTIALLGVEVVAGSIFLSRDFDLGSFFLALAGLLALGLLIVEAYSIHSIVKASYAIDAENLTINWGVFRYILPLSSIGDVLTRPATLPLPRAPILQMPGYPPWRGEVDGIGDVLFLCTTHSPSRLAFIATTGANYAISPEKRDAFVEALKLRRGHLPFRALPAEKTAPRFTRFTFWSDRVAQALLLVALLGNVATFAYVSFKFPALPPMLPLHYNSVGEIDFIGTRVEAFKIPLIGTAALVADFVLGTLLHSQEKLATHLLLATAILVQLILLVATVKIVY